MLVSFAIFRGHSAARGCHREAPEKMLQPSLTIFTPSSISQEEKGPFHPLPLFVRGWFRLEKSSQSTTGLIACRLKASSVYL